MNINEKYFLYINIGIALIYLIRVLVSYKNGILYELLSSALLIVAIIASIFVSKPLALNHPLINIDFGLVSKIIDFNLYVNRGIYILIIYIVFRLLILIVMPLFKKISKIPVLGLANRLGGAFIGFIKATVLVLLISLVLNLPIIENAQEVKENTLFKYVSFVSEKVINYTAKNVDVTVKPNEVIDMISTKINLEELGYTKEELQNIANEYGIEEINLNEETINSLLDTFGVNSINEIDFKNFSKDDIKKALDWAKDNLSNNE